MARMKQPKELAELNGMTSQHPKRYKTRTSSKTCTKVHANKPDFRNEETSWAWDSIVPALENLKIVTLQDLPTLNEMFDVYDLLVDSKRQYREFLDGNDLAEVSRSKDLMTNQKKILDMVNNLWGTWIKYTARFGLTPSDRNNIQIPDTGEEDPLAVVLGD